MKKEGYSLRRWRFTSSLLRFELLELLLISLCFSYDMISFLIVLREFLV